MQKTFVRNPYNYDAEKVSEETGLACPAEESKTQQHQKEDADINVIVKRFGLTGQLPQGNTRVPQYGDFTGISDYRGALHAVMEAKASFMAMPADLRAKFHNDPEEFVVFCTDPRNLEEMVKLGLAVKKEESTPKKPDSAPKEPPAPAKEPAK